MFPSSLICFFLLKQNLSSHLVYKVILEDFYQRKITWSEKVFARAIRQTGKNLILNSSIPQQNNKTHKVLEGTMSSLSHFPLLQLSSAIHCTIAEEGINLRKITGILFKITNKLKRWI